MKRIVWSLLIASTLILASVPEASAHGRHYRAYERHYVVRHGYSYPYWLRRNYDFHRWYLRSHYRYDFYMSWDGLYDIYRYERKYPRADRGHDRRGYHLHRRHHSHK